MCVICRHVQPFGIAWIVVDVNFEIELHHSSELVINHLEVQLFYSHVGEVIGVPGKLRKSVD